MDKFYEYLIGINENWLMVNEEGNICTSEFKNELPYMYTEWQGIFNTEKLEKNIIYNIKKLEAKENSKC